MNTKHTPGPWKALERYTNSNTIPIARKLGNDNTYAIFAECNGLGGVRGNTEGDANARLIAAAPELLEALIAAEDHLVGLYGDGGQLAESGNRPFALHNQIVAAIAKATGKE